MALNFSRAAFSGAPVRAEALSYLVECVRHGWCCSVVGPSNTGKSFLLKSLLTEEVREYCVAGDVPLPVMIFVDCLEAGDSEHAFYELLLRRTIEELEHVPSAAASLDSLKAMYQKLLGSTTDFAFRSFYASSVRTLAKLSDLRLVLILDEFYDVLRHLPPWPFRQLRALYDSLSGKLCYITGTSHHLEQLRPGAEIYEFRELFHLHTLLLGPLSEPDARRFIDYLAGKYRKQVIEPNIEPLIHLSGGHPGLLERIYGLAGDLTAPLQITPTELIHKRPIQKECERLWSELEAEQDALLALVEEGEQPLTPNQRQVLQLKGLISQQGDRVTLFSPVFSAFVQTKSARRQSQVSSKGLYCDFQTGQIWLDQQEITLKLSEPQRKLISYLYQRSGVICTYDEIAEGVWGIGEGVSPGAIYELVKRVRQKIEPDWKNPTYIITVPGKGYRLENPD
jgi:hypothetical protein